MPSRGSLAFMRTRKGLVFFWTALFVLSMALQYAAAMAPQSALALSGAVYSSNFDGSITNANHYPTKPDVYLTGGPCQGGSHLDPGDYYFEVSNPDTANLLSTDAIGNRKFTVGANGFISGTSGTHGTHAVACSGVTGVTIQLIPFLDTTNAGGEYKLTVATAASVEACAGFNADAVQSICGAADQKSDNFKVLGPGALKITKVVDGGPGDFSGSFDIHVDCGEAGSFNETIDFPTPGFVTIPKIDAGAVCTVSETGTPDAPANFQWGDPTFSGNPATIVSGGSVTVGITNHLVRETGSLEITKVVDGGTATGDFTFHVDCGQDFSGDVTITLPGSGNTTIDKIPAGASCAVTETGAPDAPSGFKWSGTDITGSPATIEADSTADVTVTNHLTALPPQINALAVPCDNTTDVSRIQIVGDLLDLHVLIDGQPADPDNDGIIVVTPGEHHWAVLDSEDQVVAEGDVNVPSCFATAPALGVTKSNNAPLVDGNPTASEGDTVTYTLDYTLTDGPVTLGVLTDVLPDGVTYVDGTATDSTEFKFVSYDAGTRTLTWNAATVTASGSVTYQATVDAGAAKLEQPLTNIATIDSEETTAVEDTSNVFVAPPPAGETSVPTTHPKTPPPTDVAGTTDSNVSGGSMLFILLGLVGLGLALVFVAPAPASIRKRR